MKTKTTQSQQNLQQQRKNSPQSTKQVTIGEHLVELRRRLLVIALFFVIASALGYQFREEIVAVIMAPLGDQKLIYLTPGGGFAFILQISIYVGLIAAVPILVHQLYSFVKPALPERAQYSAVKMILATCTLLLMGIAYGYAVAIPAALSFLENFAGANIASSLTADSYLNFFIAYILGLGILFQLPLLLLIWHYINPMSPGGLLKSEKYVVLFSFIAAALITPTPDIYNQAMIAVPIILIYQLGVAVVAVMIFRNRKVQKNISRPAAVISIPVPAAPAVVAMHSKTNVSNQINEKPVLQKNIDGIISSSITKKSMPTNKRSPQLPNILPRRNSWSVDGISPRLT